MDESTVDVAAVQAALSAHDFVLLRVCGRGGFGVVTLSQCLRSGAYVAVKLISKSRAASLGIADRVISEVSLHSRLRHPCVVDLLDFFEDAEYVYMVMNYACGGDAYQYVSRHGKLCMRDIAVFGAQLLQAIAYMHEHGVMHRDLKLSNLLLERQRDTFAAAATSDHAVDSTAASSFTRGGSTHSDTEAEEHERLHPLGCAPACPDAGGAPLSTRYSLRVADYGLAVQVASAQGAPTEHVTVCGTPAYMSPEVTAARPYGAAADMYSVGCLLFALAIGRAPQPNELLAESAYAELLRVHENSHEAQQLVSLIRSLAHPEAAARPTAAHALQHSFWSTTPIDAMNRSTHVAQDTSELTQLSVALLRAPQLEVSTDSYAYPGRSGDDGAVAARALPRADTPTRRSYHHDSDVDETNALADLLDRSALMEVPSIAISILSTSGRDRSPIVNAAASQAGSPSTEKLIRMHTRAPAKEYSQSDHQVGISPTQNDNIMAVAEVTQDFAVEPARPREPTIPSPSATRSDYATVSSISPRPALHAAPIATPPGHSTEMPSNERASEVTHRSAMQASAAARTSQQQDGLFAPLTRAEAQGTTPVPAGTPSQAAPAPVDAVHSGYPVAERSDRLGGLCLDSFSVSTIISDRTSAVEPRSIGELLDIVPQMSDAGAFAHSAVAFKYQRSVHDPAVVSTGSRSQPSVTVSSTSAESSWKSISPTGVPARRAGVPARDTAGYLQLPGSRHPTPGSFSPSFSETFSPHIPRGDVILHALLEAQDISIPRIRSPSISASDSDSSDYEPPVRRRASRRRVHTSPPHMERAPQRTLGTRQHYQRSTTGADDSRHELRVLHSPLAALSFSPAAAITSVHDMMSAAPQHPHTTSTNSEAAYPLGAAAADPAAQPPAPAETPRQSGSEATPHSHAIRAFAATDEAARARYAAQSSAHRAAAYSAYVTRSAEADTAARIRGGADAAAGLVLGAARSSDSCHAPTAVSPKHANKSQVSPAHAESAKPAHDTCDSVSTATSATLPGTLSQRQDREPVANPLAIPVPAEIQRLSVQAMPYEFDMSRHARLPAQVRCKRKDGTVVVVWKSGRVELHGSIAARGGTVSLLMWTQLGMPMARNQEADSIISQQLFGHSAVHVRIGKDQPAVDYASPGRLPSALRASWNAMVAAVEALRSRCPCVAVVTPDAAGVLMDDGPLHTFHLTARQNTSDQPWRVTYSLRTQQLVLTSPTGDSTACYAVPPAHAKLVDAVAPAVPSKDASPIPLVLSSPAHLPAHLIPLYTATLQLLAKCLSYQGAVVDDTTTPDRNPTDLPWVARLRAPILTDEAWRKLAALQSQPSVRTAAGASAGRQPGDTSAGSDITRTPAVFHARNHDALTVTDAHTRPSGDVLDASFADGSMLSVNLSTGSIMYHDHPKGAAVPVTKTEAGLAGEESVDSVHEQSSGTLPDHVRARVRVLRDFLRTHTHVHDTSMASSGGSDSHIP